MRLYLVTIGPRGAPRLSFEAIGRDSCAVVAQMLDLCLPLERVEVRLLREVAHG